jgi:hypothetical protein
MGSKTNSAISRRQSAAEKAREARIKLHKDRDARDTRVEAAVAEVFTVQDRLSAADEVLGAARAAAAKMMTDAETAHAAATRTGEGAVGAALRKLAAEKLTAAEISELTSLPTVEVRRLTKLAADQVASPVGLSATVTGDGQPLPVAV